MSSVAHNEASRVQWHTEALWLDQAAVMMLLARRKRTMRRLVPRNSALSAGLMAARPMNDANPARFGGNGDDLASGASPFLRQGIISNREFGIS